MCCGVKVCGGVGVCGGVRVCCGVRVCGGVRMGAGSAIIQIIIVYKKVTSMLLLRNDETLCILLDDKL